MKNLYSMIAKQLEEASQKEYEDALITAAKKKKLTGRPGKITDPVHVNGIGVMSKAQADKHYPGMQYTVVEAVKDLDMPTLSIDSLAKLHDMPVADIQDQLSKGIKVEMEHTSDKSVASEIARDHIKEDPKYYDKLSKVEECVELNEAKWETIKSQPATGLKRGDNVYVRLNNHTLRGGKYLQSQDGNGKPGHPKGHLIKWHTTKPGEMTDLNWHAPEHVFHDKEPGDIEKAWDTSKRVG